MVFPELSTQRLRLGKIRVSDIPTIVTYANNRNIADNTLNLPNPYHEENAVFWMNMQIQGFQKKQNYIFAIFIKETDKFIGGIGLHIDANHNKAEMGYWIGEPNWNNGFASEAGKEILKYGFKVLELNKIYATHFLQNKASEKVLKKIGMQKEATLKQHYNKNGTYIHVGQYCLLQSEYINE